MNRWRAVAVVFGTVGALSAGCSSAPPAITVIEFCAQKATEECRFVVPVCSPLTSAACQTAREMVCSNDATKATASGNRVFNPGNVAACLGAIDSTYGVLKFGMNSTLAYAGINGGPTATNTVDFLCESVFQGTAQATKQCTTDYDCAGGNVCTPSNGGSKVNVCAPLQVVGQGLSCGAAGDVCSGGNVCIPNNLSEYLCQQSTTVLGGLGATCATDADCDPGTAGYCDANMGSTCQLGYSFGGSAPDCRAFGGV